MLLAVAASVVTLFGNVTVGPVPPLCEPGGRCNEPAAGAQVTFKRAGAPAVAVRVGPAGGYRVKLRPGRYVVRADTGISLTPRTVVVGVEARGKLVRRNFAIDTGVR